MAVSANALCTLDDVKLQYGMTGSVADDDELLEGYIDSITDMFQNDCGVASFKAANYTEYYDGPGDQYLVMKNVPIISIDSIYEDSGWEWAVGTLLADTEYRIVDKKYLVNQTYFITGAQSIKITYRAGNEVIPVDLKQACIDEVIRRYKHRKDFEVMRKTLNDGTAEYVMEAWLQTTLNVLKNHKSGYIL